jgi:Fur family ferric uptake transcriptional regulator
MFDPPAKSSHMTTPHCGPALTVSTLDTALDVLGQRGLRATRARRLVLEALFEAGEPISAERIAGGHDLASVYRNLETLEAMGLVRHVHLGHGPGLYALAGAREREYLVCESCYSLRALEPSALDSIRGMIRRQFGFGAAFTHFPIVGLCPTCERS